MSEQVNTGASDLRKRYWQEYGEPPEGQGPHPDKGGPAYIPWLETLVDQLEADLKLRPSVKLSDGDVWLIFPDAAISIEGICRFRIPGPIVRRNLRKWRDELLKEALGGEQDDKK